MRELRLSNFTHKNPAQCVLLCIVILRTTVPDLTFRIFKLFLKKDATESVRPISFCDT
jgi:hypothetical protein